MQTVVSNATSFRAIEILWSALVQSQTSESAVTETVDEVRKLVDSGFIFVCDTKGIMDFSKRK